MNNFKLYKNVPTGPIPQTPLSNEFCVGETTLLCKNQIEIIREYGTLISYPEECNGALFQDVIPIKALAYSQTSTSSKQPLEIHTEQAFSDDRPDFLSLACLNGDPFAETYILTLDTLLEHLTSEQIELLKQPLWMCGVDLSFVMNGFPSEKKGPMSILQNEKLIFDQNLMEGLTPEANDLIKIIVEIYNNFKTKIILETGDVLVIDNRVCVHGRSKFTPRFDGTDRFLIRCFAKI